MSLLLGVGRMENPALTEHLACTRPCAHHSAVFGSSDLHNSPVRDPHTLSAFTDAETRSKWSHSKYLAELGSRPQRV